MQSSTASSLRKIVVTGANKGIGYSIVDGLLGGETPYNVILTARAPKKAETALHSLQEKHKNSKGKVQSQLLNITDPVSIQHFADWVQHELGTIDVLINNAGIGFWPENKAQKLETINTNFLSTIALTEKILPHLSKDGKIIMLSSGLGRLKRQGPEVRKILEDPNLTLEKLLELSGKLYEHCEHETPNDLEFSSSSYDATKCLLNAYTRWVLPKMLKGDQQCFCMDPGWCRTDMGGSNADKSPEEGADTAIYLTNLPFVKDPNLNGKFFGKRQVVEF